MTDVPMSDETLEEIDELLHNNEEVPSALVIALANEVERLRAALEHAEQQARISTKMMSLAVNAKKQAEAENAAMRPIVVAVADIENSDGSACYVTCELTLYDSGTPNEGVHHDTWCVIERAQAFVTSHPVEKEAK